MWSRSITRIALTWRTAIRQTTWNSGGRRGVGDIPPPPPPPASNKPPAPLQGGGGEGNVTTTTTRTQPKKRTSQAGETGNVASEMGKLKSSGVDAKIQEPNAGKQRPPRKQTSTTKEEGQNRQEQDTTTEKSGGLRQQLQPDGAAAAQHGKQQRSGWKPVKTTDVKPTQHDTKPTSNQPSSHVQQKKTQKQQDDVKASPQDAQHVQQRKGEKPPPTRTTQQRDTKQSTVTTTGQQQNRPKMQKSSTDITTTANPIPTESKKTMPQTYVSNHPFRDTISFPMSYYNAFKLQKEELLARFHMKDTVERINTESNVFELTSTASLESFSVFQDYMKTKLTKDATATTQVAPPRVRRLLIFYNMNNALLDEAIERHKLDLNIVFDGKVLEDDVRIAVPAIGTEVELSTCRAKLVGMMVDEYSHNFPLRREITLPKNAVPGAKMKERKQLFQRIINVGAFAHIKKNPNELANTWNITIYGPTEDIMNQVEEMLQNSITTDDVATIKPPPIRKTKVDNVQVESTPVIRIPHGGKPTNSIIVAVPSALFEQMQNQWAMKISNIQHRTKTHFTWSRGADATYEVTIAGESQDEIAVAKKMMLNILDAASRAPPPPQTPKPLVGGNQLPKSSPSRPTAPSQQWAEATLFVPSIVAPRIVGTKGARIQEIRNSTGALVVVGGKTADTTRSGKTKVYIRGPTSEIVEQAKEMITAIVESSGRTKRRGTDQEGKFDYRDKSHARVRIPLISKSKMQDLIDKHKSDPVAWSMDKMVESLISPEASPDETKNMSIRARELIEAALTMSKLAIVPSAVQLDKTVRAALGETPYVIMPTLPLAASIVASGRILEQYKIVSEAEFAKITAGEFQDKRTKSERPPPEPQTTQPTRLLVHFAHS